MRLVLALVLFFSTNVTAGEVTFKLANSVWADAAKARSLKKHDFFRIYNFLRDKGCVDIDIATDFKRYEQIGEGLFYWQDRFGAVFDVDAFCESIDNVQVEVQEKKNYEFTSKIFVTYSNGDSEEISSQLLSLE